MQLSQTYKHEPDPRDILTYVCAEHEEGEAEDDLWQVA
jgi:hypothetical protein